MASKAEIEFVYDDMDALWRACLGERADISAAFYDGDFGKTLEQAQTDKHNWILERVGFKQGQLVIDIGCGWGPMLKAVKERGGEAFGITLSPKQVRACAKNGLIAQLMDWKDPYCKSLLGNCNSAVISIGAFEHFCSVKEFLAGEQRRIYRDFFKLCSSVLLEKGKLFLQTMTWGEYPPWGKGEPTLEDIRRCSLDSSKGSDARVVAMFLSFFPGTWLPRDENQIVEAAEPYFELVESNDGRLDYIKTLTEWWKAWYAPGPGRTRRNMRIVGKYLAGPKRCRMKLECIRNNDIREAFIRNLLGHRRMIFQKRSS